MANAIKRASGYPTAPTKPTARRGFTFPLVLGLMLMSFLTLLGILQLVQGQARHLAVVRQYYTASIQWQLVNAQLAKRNTQDILTWVSSLLTISPTLIDQTLDVGDHPLIEQVDAAHYLVRPNQGPHQGQLVWVSLGLRLPDRLTQRLSPQEREALQVFTLLSSNAGEPGQPLTEESDAPSRLREAGWHFLSREVFEQDAHWDIQARPAQVWQFSTGSIVAGSDHDHYINRVQEGDFQRQETFNGWEGDYTVIVFASYYTQSPP